MTIVSYSTFRRWVRKIEDDTPPPAKKLPERRAGRPKLEEDVRETIIRIRKETGFGYTKILQEMRRMGVHVSRQTVKNVIVAAGLKPTPGDHPDTWHKFIKRHADTLWQCDFACKRKWTLKGLVDLYLNAFCVVTNQHLDRFLRAAQDWYNKRRGHSARDHLPPTQGEASFPLIPFSKNQVICDTTLGGHLISYRRTA